LKEGGGCADFGAYRTTPARQVAQVLDKTLHLKTIHHGEIMLLNTVSESTLAVFVAAISVILAVRNTYFTMDG
jgi:hypothetical protein